MQSGTFNLNHFKTDNSCFEIDMVQAETSLQRKTGIKNPQSPFMF